MELLPPIDIRSGRVVRLTNSEAAVKVAYELDPVARAEQLVWQGATWLHLADLDRAHGDGDNAELISRIVTRVGSYVRIELAGGLRSTENFRAVRDLEVARYVIDPVTAVDERGIESAIEILGTHRTAIGLDARGGFVTLGGWTETSDIRTADVARRASAAGIRTAVYRDLARDGMLSGPDIAGAAALQAEGLGAIVSGGVASLADLVAAREAGLAGAIVGRALYEGRFSLADALQAAAGS